jgi:PilZ domain-containing protein
MSEGQPIYTMEIKSRAHERRPWGLETWCRLAVAEHQPWPALVRDLSRGGVGLVLDTFLEPESELTIEIPVAPGRLRVVVVHATTLPGGKYLLGCRLVKPLSEEEVQKLLAGTEKPKQ